MQTTAITACPKCSKKLTHDNCSSWSADTGFYPRPCAHCKALACDDCSEHWSVCSCCGGGICHECAASVRSRVVTDTPAYGAPCRTRAELLCGGCATSQDAAKSKLAEAIEQLSTETSGTPFSFGDAWLSDIVPDLEDALRKAKNAL